MDPNHVEGNHHLESSDGTSLNTVGTSLNPDGVSLNNAGTSLDSDGISLNPGGTSLNHGDTSLNPVGTSLYPDGKSLNSGGALLNSIDTSLACDIQKDGRTAEGSAPNDGNNIAPELEKDPVHPEVVSDVAKSNISVPGVEPLDRGVTEDSPVMESKDILYDSTVTEEIHVTGHMEGVTEGSADIGNKGPSSHIDLEHHAHLSNNHVNHNDKPFEVDASKDGVPTDGNAIVKDADTVDIRNMVKVNDKGIDVLMNNENDTIINEGMSNFGSKDDGDNTNVEVKGLDNSAIDIDTTETTNIVDQNDQTQDHTRVEGDNVSTNIQINGGLDQKVEPTMEGENDITDSISDLRDKAEGMDNTRDSDTTTHDQDINNQGLYTTIDNEELNNQVDTSTLNSSGVKGEEPLQQHLNELQEKDSPVVVESQTHSVPEQLLKQGSPQSESHNGLSVRVTLTTHDPITNGAYYTDRTHVTGGGPYSIGVRTKSAVNRQTANEVVLDSNVLSFAPLERAGSYFDTNMLYPEGTGPVNLEYDSSSPPCANDNDFSIPEETDTPSSGDESVLRLLADSDSEVEEEEVQEERDDEDEEEDILDTDDMWGPRTPLHALIQDEDGDDSEVFSQGMVDPNFIGGVLDDEPMVIDYKPQFGEGPVDIPAYTPDGLCERPVRTSRLYGSSSYNSNQNANEKMPLRAQHIKTSNKASTNLNIDKKTEWRAESKVGSLGNLDHTPKKSKKKIFNSLPKWKKQSKVLTFENMEHEPPKSEVKIIDNPVTWTGEPRIGSMDNLGHLPGGGEVQIPKQKLKWKAEAKVGSLDNIKHFKEVDNKFDTMDSITEEEEGTQPDSPRKDGLKVPKYSLNSLKKPKRSVGYPIVFHEKLRWKKQSKIGSFDNIHYQPGVGDVTSRRNDVIMEEDEEPHCEPAAKVGSLENVGYKPSGGAVKIPHHRLHWSKKSKVDSLRGMFQLDEEKQILTQKYDVDWSVLPEHMRPQAQNPDPEASGSVIEDSMENLGRTTKPARAEPQEAPFNPVDQWFKDFKQKKKSRREMLKSLDEELEAMDKEGPFRQYGQNDYGSSKRSSRKHRKVKPAKHEENTTETEGKSGEIDHESDKLPQANENSSTLPSVPQPTTHTQTTSSDSVSLPSVVSGQSTFQSSTQDGCKSAHSSSKAASVLSTTNSDAAHSASTGVHDSAPELLQVSGTKSAYMVRPKPESDNKLGSRSLDSVTSTKHHKSHPTKLAPVEAPESQGEKLLWINGTTRKSKPRIRSLGNTEIIPGINDHVKIKSERLKWKAQPRVGSLDNVGHNAGGGMAAVYNERLSWKGDAKVDSGSGPRVVREGTYDVIKNYHEE